MNRNANAVRAMALGIALASAGAIAEEPEGLDGEWKGRWNGGGQIRMTVERATEASPKVTYCFKRRCWEPEGLQIEGSVVTFRAKPNLSYRMDLREGKVHAQLVKGGRTFRGRMTRVEEKAPAPRQPQQIDHGGK